MKNTMLNTILIASPMYGVNAPACEYSVGLSKYIRITDITDEGKYLPDHQYYVSCANPEQYFLHENDIVIARTGASVGKSYLYNKNDGTLVFAGFLIKISVDPEKADSRYVFEYLHTKQYLNWVKTESTRSGQPGINGQQYASFNLLLPPLPEQHRIATVLSDTDMLISTLEKLIAKKRAIKQGVMQELLTGKKRLSGFSEKWVEKSLRDFGHCVRGVSYNPSTDLFICENHNTLTLLRANNIVNDKIEPSNVLYVDKSVVSTEQKLLQGDIVIAMSSGSVVAIGKTGYYIGTSEMYCVGAFCAIFRSEINHYIRFLFQSTMFREQLATFLEGTSINNLNSRIIEGMTFHFPQKKEEIIAITTILSDMDIELDALTTKLTKLRQIKQAMMSDLLTGRIRLPKQEPQKKHNQAIEDAVILGVITELYAEEKYPLTPFLAQKLPYLLHRHIDGIAKGYHKLSAGPYNPSYRYKTALPIALKNSYVIKHKATYMGHEYNNLTIGENCCEAKKYFLQWHGDEPLNWLMQFRYIKNRRNELELLTTVDMAMIELRHNNMPITVTAVKEIIKNSEEWKAKLKRELFSDANIGRAIKWSNNLFGMEDTHNDAN